MKKEVTMKLSEKIGETLFEVEFVLGSEMVELAVRDADGSRISGLDNFEPGEMETIAVFFRKVADEIAAFK